METTLAPNRNITVREYIDILVGMLRSPSEFYTSVAGQAGMRKPMLFLCISALFYSTVSMSYFYENSLTMGGIYLFNAIAMPLLAAVFSFTLAGMVPGARADFSRVASVYAYASGAVMVVSWIPALGIVFELIRAALVTVGLRRGCGMGWVKSVTVVAGTAFLLLAFIWSLQPVLLYMKEFFSA